MPTRTGGFPIGFRRAGVEWQRDLMALANWTRESGFESLDLTHPAIADDFGTLSNAGLSLGSVDILEFQQVMSSDPGRRKDVLEKNLKYIRDAAAGGAKAFFTCIIPGEPSQTRAENYRLAIECVAPLAHACAAADASLAIEGWPGGPPHYAN